MNKRCEHVFTATSPTKRTATKTTPEQSHLLRYTDIEEAIRLARLAGMTTIQIVRALSGSVPYSEALKSAKKAAPILGLTVKAFMELRRNR